MRKPDWEKQLAAYFKRRWMTPFEWGTFDCCQFVSEAIEAMTGFNPGGPHQGSYRNRKEATAVLNQIVHSRFKPALSYRDAIELLPGHFGFEPVEPAFASRGDLVLINSHTSQTTRRMRHPVRALGIVDFDARWAIVTGGDGLIRIAMKEAVTAWRV